MSKMWFRLNVVLCFKCELFSLIGVIFWAGLSKWIFKIQRLLYVFFFRNSVFISGASYAGSKSDIEEVVDF